jgi:glycosyltransferase involved in cell wall biosynthesis
VRLLTLYYKHRPGGMMQMTYRLLLGGAERGWEMHYLAVEPYRIAHPRLHAHLLPSPREHASLLFWSWFFLTAPLAAAILAWRRKVDVLAVFEGTYGWAALPARRLLGLPLVVFLQSDVATINRLHGRPAIVRRIEQWMEGMALRRADRIVATNRSLADLVRERWRLPPQKIAVVPNNVRTPPRASAAARSRLARETGMPADAFVVATSGVFSPRKNLGLLLQAFAELSSPRIHLVVVGEGAEAEGWRRTVAAACASAGGERLHFLGWRRDVVEVLGGCDLFVFPTRHEGSPLSLIEALRVGLPCIGSDIPEIREVLGDDPACLFGPDDVAALRHRIEQAAADASFAARLRDAAARRAALYDFDWESEVTSILDEALRCRRADGAAPSTRVDAGGTASARS